MLSKNDMVLIRGALKEVLTNEVPEIVDGVIQKTVPGMIESVIRQTVPGMIEANNHILKREIRDEIHSLIKASEAGLIRRMDAIKGEILDGVAEIIDDRVLPQIDDLDRRVLHLEALPIR